MSSLGRSYRTVIPERYQSYECTAYFESERFTRGFYDEAAHLHTFYPAAELVEHPALGFLAIGRPGVGGIEWGYRRGQTGLWAYYPTTGEFEHLAPTVAELFEGWYAGRITV